MKKYLLIPLLSLAIIPTQAATSWIDFGRADFTTEGWVNVTERDTSYSFNNGVSGNVTFGVALSGGAAEYVKSDATNSDWRNDWQGSIHNSNPATSGDAFGGRSHTGEITLTVSFSGLQPGVYSLSIFEGTTGRDQISKQTWLLGGAGVDASNVDWTGQVSNSSRVGSTTDWVGMGASTGDSIRMDGINVGAQNGHGGGYFADASNIIVGEDGILTLTMTGDNQGNSYGSVMLNSLGLTRTGSLPVPEPSSAALGVLGLTGLMLRRRRK